MFGKIAEKDVNPPPHTIYYVWFRQWSLDGLLAIITMLTHILWNCDLQF